jgi:hypothetical protein
VDKAGNLMVVGELFFDHRETECILSDIETGSAKWGIGLVTELTVVNSKVIKKRITGLELTKEPTYDTWILKAARTSAFLKDWQKEVEQ